MKPTLALVHFGWRQTRRGALIIALLVAGIMILQGTAYNAVAPNEKAREQFAATLSKSDMLGFVYGEPEGIDHAAVYMVYRSGPFLALIASIWALLVSVRLLRGNEEDGRLEALASGATTVRQASTLLLLGFLLSFGVSFVIASAFMIAAGHIPDLTYDAGRGILATATVYGPALVAIGLGILLSQFWTTRRRTVSVGIGIIAILFLLRSVGNILPDWYWLKNFTPFGWADRIHPMLDAQSNWLLPVIGAALVCAAVGVFLAGRRDLASGLLRERSSHTPRYELLNTAWLQALRDTFPVTIAWAIGTTAMAALIAGVSSLAVESTLESPELKQIVLQFAGGETNNLKLAFLGSGIMFTSITLCIMTAVALGDIRQTESRQYLENILVRSVGRVGWLVGRIGIVFMSVLASSLLVGCVVWAISQTQDIELSLATMLAGSVQLMGAVGFCIGLGVLVFGIIPKFTSVAIYIVLLYSFLIDIIKDIGLKDIPDFIFNSSLLQYVSLVPAHDPDWKAFWSLLGIGTVLSIIGIWRFTKRDYVSE